MAEIPISNEIVRFSEGICRLLGSRCLVCGNVTFPSQSSCILCSGTKLEKVELGPVGTLWAWTIQHFMPKSPYRSFTDENSFIPFGVGYVELEDGLKIEAPLTENNPEKLKIGMEMELMAQKVFRNSDGQDVIGFAFQPVRQESYDG